MSKQTYFSPGWVNESRFSSWLAEVKGNNKLGLCRLCDRTIKLGNMGAAALVSHSEGKKHKLIVENLGGKACNPHPQRSVSDFFSCPVTSTSSGVISSSESASISFSFSEDGKQERCLEAAADDLENQNLCIPPPPQPPVAPAAQGAPPQKAMAQYLGANDTKKAEILWALKTVLSHLSYNSSKDISTLFKIVCIRK